MRGCLFGCVLLGTASGLLVQQTQPPLLKPGAEARGWFLAKPWTDKGTLTPPWGLKFSMPAGCTHVMVNVGPNKSPIRGDPGAFVILIDPLPEVTRFLQQKHASATTVVYQAAISNFTGHAEFHVYNGEGVSSSLAVHPGWSRKTLQVPVHTLRELLDAIPPGMPITMLQTDMQGNDLTAIKSAGPAIGRVHEIISEVYQDGYSTYAGVQNELSNWLPYMQKVGFEKQSCKPAFHKELDCSFHRAPTKKQMNK
jgi:FkbM family methyltransferase